MDYVNTITSFISTIGFPIVCVIYMWKYISTTQKEFTEAIKNNTVMISKLCEKLDADGERGNHDEKI